MDVVVGRQFRIVESIASGGFGSIYKGEDIKTHEPVAIKTESKKFEDSVLESEAKIYKMIKGMHGFPELKFYGNEGSMNILVIDLLGKSINTIFKEHERKFSLKTVCMIAEQVLNRLQSLHEKGIVHGDIKPDNFVIGTGKNSGEIFLVDFGLSRMYIDAETTELLDFSKVKKFVGTAKYASLSVHRNVARTRRDDLESLGYTLVYLMKGCLPWEHCTGDDKVQKIFEIKGNTSVAKLCVGLPDEFDEYMEIVRGLEFYEDPDYELLRNLFRNLMQENELVNDRKFDWNE